MHVLLQLLNTIGPKSSVPDTVFATVGALANALEEGFSKYMESFVHYLYNALGNQDEPGLCAMAIGLVSDITRSLGVKAQPYCDYFMNYLLGNLRVRFLLYDNCFSLISFRVRHSATSSSQQSYSVLVISLKQLVPISKHICLSSLRYFSKRPP